MALVIFGTTQTYNNPALPVTLQDGSISGNAIVDWTPGTVLDQNAFPVTTYPVATTGIAGVLLTPDPGYTYYLNQSGVGGVATVLEFSPSGSLSGPQITEGVLVGSFAHWNQAATAITALANYVLQTQSNTEITAFNVIATQAVVGLLQGGNPNTEASTIESTATNLGDPTFSSLAATLASVVTSWDTPVYFLNTGSGVQYFTSDPAGFGLNLKTINGAEATWSVSGAQGTLTETGYTEYSTYNSSTNKGLLNVVPAETNGDLAVASTSSSGPTTGSTTITAAHGSLNEYIALLYQGALGRTPDLPGLQGWEQIGSVPPIPSEFQTTGVYVLSDVSGNFNGNLSIAGGFTNSAEFIAKYGSLTNAQFVTNLYSNILDRAPDTAGFNGWMSLLAAGNSREHVLVGFADSAEAISNATHGFVGQSGTHAAWLFLT
jgi:hypothetical protein